MPSRLSALRALSLFLSLASPLLGQSPKSITFVAFKFDDVTLDRQESGQNTAQCVETDLVAHLNQEFRQRPRLKYWQFQSGKSSQYPYLLLSIHWVEGWYLGIKVVNPKSQPVSPVEEPLFGPGEKTDPPSGCVGWKPLVLKALDRLIKKWEADLQKTLQAVPVTGMIEPLTHDLAKVLLPANSEQNELLQRQFHVELVNLQSQGGEMYPCGTGRPGKLSAEVRLSQLSSIPPDVFPGFIAKRYTPFAVYLTEICHQMTGVSEVPK